MGWWGGGGGGEGGRRKRWVIFYWGVPCKADPRGRSDITNTLPPPCTKESIYNASPSHVLMINNVILLYFTNLFISPDLFFYFLIFMLRAWVEPIDVLNKT